MSTHEDARANLHPQPSDEIKPQDTVCVKILPFAGKVGTIARIRRSTGAQIDSVPVYHVELPGIGVLPFLREDLERVESEVGNG